MTDHLIVHIQYEHAHRRTIKCNSFRLRTNCIEFFNDRTQTTTIVALHTVSTITIKPEVQNASKD
jgi:hypothetical protein